MINNKKKICKSVNKFINHQICNKFWYKSKVFGLFRTETAYIDYKFSFFYCWIRIWNISTHTRAIFFHRKSLKQKSDKHCSHIFLTPRTFLYTYKHTLFSCFSSRSYLLHAKRKKAKNLFLNSFLIFLPPERYFCFHFHCHTFFVYF